MNFPVLCPLPFSHSTTLAVATVWPAPGRCLCVGSHELAVGLWAEHCLLLYSHWPMPGTHSRCSVNVCCLFTVEIYFKMHLYKCRGDKREGGLPCVWGNRSIFWANTKGVWSTSFLAEDPAHTKAQFPLSATSDYFATNSTIKGCYNCNVTDKIPWSTWCYPTSVWARILADVSRWIAECIRAWATEGDCIGLNPGSATCSCVICANCLTALCFIPLCRIRKLWKQCFIWMLCRFNEIQCVKHLNCFWNRVSTILRHCTIG